MSFLDENKPNETEASEELEHETADSSEELTNLEDLINDTELNGPDDLDVENYRPTIHFEVADIFNALEHIDVVQEEASETPAEKELAALEAEAQEDIEAEPAVEESEINSAEPAVEEPGAIEEHAAEESVTAEASVQAEPSEELASAEPGVQTEPGAEDLETEKDFEQESEPDSAEGDILGEPSSAEPDTGVEPDAQTESSEKLASAEPDTGAGPDVPEEPAAPILKQENPTAKIRKHDDKTKKLVITDIILFAVIAVSITVGLIAANSLVDKANAANETKIAEMQANVKEVNLAESLYDMAASQVIENVAVPTYTLDELYAMDLREPTGFTAKDLELITRRGLVGCEEAFVKAEETYGVNCIFLMSIASLESAYGTQMFRPNNMFGYGRSGFSSKQEGIMTVAKGLGTRYLNPGGSLYGGSPTLKGVNKRYAANPQWYYKVGKYMQGYYDELASEKNGALDKFE